LDGNVLDVFALDSDTGILSLAKYLDYERESVYNLNISASDSGTPKLHSWTLCEIQIEDANDNPPSFPNTAVRDGHAQRDASRSLGSMDADGGAGAGPELATAGSGSVSFLDLLYQLQS
jgi:hypothetical protein